LGKKIKSISATYNDSCNGSHSLRYIIWFPL